jgi:hypothetical protein
VGIKATWQRIRPRTMVDYTAIYIAVAVTVLGIMILSSVGTNSDQNSRIAEQARDLAKSNREASFAGCKRGNFVRIKINTVSGALAQLLHRSVAESEAEGIVLTEAQVGFLDRLYEKLAPLKPVNCHREYGRQNEAGSRAAAR